MWPPKVAKGQRSGRATPSKIDHNLHKGTLLNADYDDEVRSYSHSNVTSRGYQMRSHLWPLTSVGYIYECESELTSYHRNQRPKNTCVQLLIDFGGRHPTWPLTFGDLWGSRLWMWIGTNFTIVISAQKSTCVQILIDLRVGHPTWPLTFGGLWRSHLWLWIGTDFTIVFSMSMATCAEVRWFWRACKGVAECESESR